MKKRLLLASALSVSFGIYCAGTNTSEYPNNGADMSVPPGADLAGMTNGCATATYFAQQAPAAMMVLLDRSSSMVNNNKWQVAGQAIVDAIDQDVFDSMSLGLYLSPAGTVMGPTCYLGGFIPVACANPTFPDVRLAAAGTAKTSASSGVRSTIYSKLSTTLPDGSGYGDATPLYGAIQASIASLQGYQTVKRMLMVVSDGTIDCTSIDSPQRAAFKDANGCNDWEDPTNIINMLKAANQDASKPVETFIVGVPGADTYDPSAKMYPPYHMRLALSAMAYAGSPSNVPANCTGKTFTQAGADPTVSCHIDLTQGSFSAQALGTAISNARGKVAGCIYDLPTPQTGTLDKSQVNVILATDGKHQDLYRRKDQSNTCTQTGCWDYTTDGKVQLIGAACTSAQTAGKVDVSITVGCQTVVG